MNWELEGLMDNVKWGTLALEDRVTKVSMREEPRTEQETAELERAYADLEWVLWFMRRAEEVLPDGQHMKRIWED